MADWSFFTNHGLVLATIAKQPKSTAREIGDAVGITERTAHKIINDLETEGYITKVKTGRKNRYRIHSNVPLVDEQSLASFWPCSAGNADAPGLPRLQLPRPNSPAKASRATCFPVV